jgi:hypothetical protein
MDIYFIVTVLLQFFEYKLDLVFGRFRHNSNTVKSEKKKKKN